MTSFSVLRETFKKVAAYTPPLAEGPGLPETRRHMPDRAAPSAEGPGKRSS